MKICDFFSQWETIAACVVMKDVDLCSLHVLSVNNDMANAVESPSSKPPMENKLNPRQSWPKMRILKII